MTDKKFERELQIAANIVKSWPEWKRTSLQVTAMATTPAPRNATSSHVSGDTGKCGGHSTTTMSDIIDDR